MNKKPKQTLLQRVRRLLLDIEDVTRADTTGSGEAFVLFALVDGKEVRIDQDGFATIEGSQAPAGEHKLANGNLLVIDGQGQFVETKEPSDKTVAPDKKTAPQPLAQQRQKMSEAKPEFVEALKAKVSEMQTIIDTLTQALDQAQGTAKEAVEEMEKLRRQTPSTRPAIHRAANLSAGDMTTSERLAVALSQSIQRRK